MPSAASVSAYKLIRSLWPQSSIYDMLFENSPTLGLFKKDTNFVEQVRYIGVGYGAPQGIGPDFGIAKQFKTPSKALEFQHSTTTYYAAFSILGDLLRKSKYGGNKALIVDPMKRDSRNIMKQVKNDLSSYIHGNGGGALGRMTAASTPTSSATVTLRAGADKRRIEPAMALWTSSTDGTSGSVNGGYVTVASLGGTDTAPTVVVDQTNWQTGISGTAASDYIFRAGVFGNVLDGLDGINPSHSGSPGTYKGVNRNLYADRLAGYCLDGTKMTPRQRLLRAARIVADAGGKADTYLMSTRNWENLHNDLQATGSLRFTKAPAAKVGSISIGVTYDAIEFIGPTGKIEVFADPWMPDDVERCIDRSVFVLASTGELVHWDDDVGPDSPMVEESADAREVRLVGDMAFYSEAPAYSCRVSVTA
jgi:hypothetical protein